MMPMSDDIADMLLNSVAKITIIFAGCSSCAMLVSGADGRVNCPRLWDQERESQALIRVRGGYILDELLCGF